MFELRDPWLLLLLLLVPVIYRLAAQLPRGALYSSISLLESARPSLRARLSILPALLLTTGWVLLSIAVAGPRTADSSSEQKREGIAIVMVVDRSSSMLARDFVRNASQTRLDVVKQVFERFVLGGEGAKGRPDDLVGLVVFAAHADGLCPLTLDHRNLAAILGDVAIATERSEDGTAVGDGLALAVERLRHHRAPSKVAILLTDGVSNAGDIDPLRAAELAAHSGVRVYTIGAGTTGYAPVQVTLPDGRVGLQRAFVQIDEETLREIAKRTGGRYFHAGNAEALEEVTAEIDRLERSEVRELRYLEYRHHYAGLAVGGLGALVAASILSATWLRRLP